jgi:AGZA family xanthine/uracil permease-like MFS transporter
MGSELALGGLLALGQGGLLTSMLWAAAALSAFGVIHAYALSPAGIEGRIGWGAAPEFALSYAAGGVFLLLCGWYERRVGRADSL